MKEVRPDLLASSGQALIAQVKKCGRAAQTVEETVEDHQPCFSKPQYFSYLELEARVGIEPLACDFLISVNHSYNDMDPMIHRAPCSFRKAMTSEFIPLSPARIKPNCQGGAARWETAPHLESDRGLEPDFT
jgi:hypothetical protein